MNGPKIYASKEEAPEGARFVSARNSALRELFSVENPKERKGTPEYKEKQEQFVKECTIASIYVYYPWRNLVIEMLPEEEYFALRTARNKNVVTKKEQHQFRSGRVAVAGLSVGSAVTHALAMSGGPKHIKVADFDVVEVTNLNRLRAGLVHVEEEKTLVAAQQIWELDPFAEVEMFPQGINDENIEDFALNPRVDVLIDEMEDVRYKIWLRLIAKREGIPVLMATDNGNGIILDIERFDLDEDLPIFHGLVEFSDPAELKDLAFRDWLKLATQIVGPEHLGDRMRESILEIGNTIPSVPQLGISASFAGSAICFAVRELLAGRELPSGRFEYSLEELIDPSYGSAEAKEARKLSAENFMQQLRNRG